MRLDKTPPKINRRRAARVRKGWHSGLAWALLLVSVAIAFSIGAYAGATGRAARVYGEVLERVKPIRSQNLLLVKKALTGLLSEPEHLVINIKFNDYRKLAEQRERALDAHVLIASDDDFVPATINNGESSIPVQIRLKGDLVEHFKSGSKWSFRVKTRGENTLFGMKRFSLHHPGARNHIYEWIFHRALRREGIIGLRYQFVRVTLNGKGLGIYALEEHFAKELVEDNSRREGPILRFSEDRLWQEWRLQKIPFPGARQNGSGSFLASEVDAFRSNRWLGTQALRDMHDKAIHLLRSFQRGELPTHSVFDIDKMATFLALVDLMGAEHGARWHNTRFYYNPVTSRLEPIGFDGDAGCAPRFRCEPISFLAIHMRDRHWSYNAWSSDPTYFEALFKDEQLVERYLGELRRVSEAGYVDELVAELGDELEVNLRKIYREFPSFEFSPDVLKRNQHYIRSVIEPAVPLSIHARRAEADQLELMLGNLQALPIDVVGVRLEESPRESLLREHLRLPGRKPQSLVEFATVNLDLPSDEASEREGLERLRVQYRLPGVEAIHEMAVTSWPFTGVTDLTTDILRRPSNVASFDFIEVDEFNHLLRFRPGDWEITEDLILPEGYVARSGPGTRLHLTNGAMIVSRSQLQFVGAEEDPVVIDSPDGTGQGLLVTEAPETSILEHVVFRSLTSPLRQGWSLTGAVTFYESDARFSACEFLSNRAEDSLNVIRARFSVEHSVFRDTPSDALDADFSRGEITRSLFENLGNDGIDVSGSQVEISTVTVRDAGDKAISIGERSQVEASSLSLERARIALAIKDLSDLNASDVTVSDSEIALALYRKKPEFGPASARLGGLQLFNVEHDYKIEDGSTVFIDDRFVESNESDLARRLEPASESAGIP